MIINGKHVEFAITVRTTPFILGIKDRKTLAERVKSIENQSLKALVESCLQGNKELFFSLAQFFIKEQFVEVLNEHADLLTNDHTLVRIAVFSNPKSYLGSYKNELSSLNEPFFEINACRAMLVASRSMDNFKEAIIHEFIHYFDIFDLKRGDKTTHKIEEVYKKTQSELLEHFKVIRLILYRTRDEGIAKFYSAIRKHGKISLFCLGLEIIKNDLDQLSAIPPKDVQSDIMAIHAHSESASYLAGPCIVFLILARILFVNKLENRLVIEYEKHYLGIKHFSSKREDPATKKIIRYLYGRESFKVLFINDVTLNGIIFDSLKQMTKSDLNKFLSLYEESCEFFKIPTESRYLNGKSLYYYSALCKFNLQLINLQEKRRYAMNLTQQQRIESSEELLQRKISKLKSLINFS